MKFSYKEAYYYEKGFEEYLNLNIGPLLEKVERHRRATLQKFFGALFGCIILLVFVCMSFVYYEDSDLPPFLFVIWIIFTFAILGFIKGSFTNKAKFKVNTILVKYFGEFIYRHKRGIDEDLVDHIDFIIPDYDYIDYDDYIYGEHQGNKIEFCEANVKEEYEDSEGDTHTRSIFKGLFIVITLQQSFSGKTFIVKDRGAILNFFRKCSTQYKRIPSPDHKEFDSRFEVYSSDINEGIKILTPSLKNRILKLAKFLGVSTINSCFFRNKVILAVPISKNLYESVSLFKPAYSEYNFKCFIRDFHMVLRLSEELSGHFEMKNTPQEMKNTL